MATIAPLFNNHTKYFLLLYLYVVVDLIKFNYRLFDVNLANYMFV